MSKIKELLKDDTSILVFDIDGVLAVEEWGEHNHFALTDEEWTKACKSGINGYTEDRVSPRMKHFIEGKNKSNLYVITTVGDNNEGEFKKQFANRYYGIPLENVYHCQSDIDKTKILSKIKEKNPNVSDEKIIMIDDTTNILNNIMENTNFSTVHISSFLDI
ncbi:MAG: hypothetical protein IKP28_06745 [Clostridia bacterium]|nr:hypothetical protein [Clostridia bacterium]